MGPTLNGVGLNHSINQYIDIVLNCLFMKCLR